MKDYKEYSKNLKKLSNPKNIEETKKVLIKAEEDLEYLKSIADKDMVVLAKIEVEKVEKFNYDVPDLGTDEVEINIAYIDGLNGDRILKVFLVDQKEKWEGNVKNGGQNIKIKAKIHQTKMD